MKDSKINGILLLYRHPLWENAPTILEHVNAFLKHSRFKVWPINTERGFPRGLKDLHFRVVVLHYSLFGTWPRLQLNGQYLHYLDQCKESYKIAFFQDEHHFCRTRFDFINHFNLDCIYTLIEPKYFKDVYTKYTKVKSLVYTLTGYVSDDLISIGKKLFKADHERRIDIGYRTRQLAYYMGKGAQEKTDIANGFIERNRGLHLKLNIGTEEKDRIYGHRWYEFLADCRGVLGVEAGVSIFDVEDIVRMSCERMLAENPGLSFAELSRKLLDSWEGNIYYRTISPRHFEAAALRVCQILFEGKYSGILQPMVHYIPLKKDFSNFDEVIRLFLNKNIRQQLTENAYRDLIASGQYSYRVFISDFDRHLLDKYLINGISREEEGRVSKELARARLISHIRALLKLLRYYPYPGKAMVTKPLKPFVEKYRHYRQGKGGELF